MGNAFVAGAKCYIPYKKELGGYGVPPTPANENLYWEQTTEDELGSGWIVREKVKSWEPDEKYETLRKQYSNAAIAAESAQDEIRILKQENTAFDNNFRSVVRENDKLREKDKELQLEIHSLKNRLAMAECVADATEYQTMHSPISAKFHTDRLYKNLIWLWGTVVAFAVNEVIQWLTR